MSNSDLRLIAREHELKEFWTEKEKFNPVSIPVNESQYSFDTEARERDFIEQQFQNAADRQRYLQYRAEWYRRAKEFDAGPAPLAVTCELVSTCNLGCPMCYTITEEFQNSVVGAQRMLPWPIVKAVIDECAELGIPSMLFSWRGESTIYRSIYNGTVYRFPDVLAYARKQGILEVTSLTHGQMIDDEMAQAIVEAEPNWISVSIDGLFDAYNKIRTPKAKRNSEYNAFQTVIENIKQLIAFRDAKGQHRPQIRVNSIYPAVARDPEAYNQFMADIGINWVTINELLDMRGEELPEEDIRDDWACQYPFQRLTVSANGVLLPCTGAHNEESGLVLGRYKGSPPKTVRNMDGTVAQIDVPETIIQKAWHSEKLEQIRSLHKNGERKSIVPGCKHCRHGAKKHGADWVPEDWDMEKMEWIGREWRE